MKVDIDKIISGLDPWDLSVVIDGHDYAIRPICVGELASLGSGDEFASLFEGPTPPRKIHPDAESAVTAAISAYIQERARKNFRTLIEKATMSAKEKARVSPN